MAQKSISRLDAFDFASQEREGTGRDSFSVQPHSVPAAPAASAADLALDLVLHEMLQQARLASSATGAAVALLSESEVRCRATAGATAAEIAAYLQTNRKLLDACVRTGTVQRCDDTESDVRFEVAACRRLGLRAVVICPVLNQQERTVGVLELFSSRPAAFGERDVLMLEAIGQRIIDNLGLVERLAVPVDTQTASEESIQHEISELAEPHAAQNDLTFQLHAPRRKALQIDSKLFLLVAAIMLSIILGWMLGRTQGVRVKGRAKPKPAPAVQMVPQQASSTATNAGAPEVVEPTVSANELSDSASGTVVEIARSPKIRHVAVPKHSDSGQAIAATPAESSPGSLVVFEDEKSASQPTQLSQDLSQESKAVGNAAAMANLKGVAHLSADEAEANLLLRIEPDYPEKARQQKIQGSVVLDIIVGNDGKVHGISTISGDPQLALAAAHAVQQWRFKPWLRNGKPSPFESRITLNFSLH